MKKNEKQKKGEKEQNEAWNELLEFANQSISVVEGIIDRQTFIEQGKKRFKLLSKKIFDEK